MKNVQVIDGAQNCHFPIFQATDEEFALIFPAEGQDIEFSEDLFSRLSEDAARRVVEPMWERPIEKSKVDGIHGTLLYQFESKRKHWPKSKRQRDWSPVGLNAAERRMFGHNS
jgi:hypothetical protein